MQKTDRPRWIPIRLNLDLPLLACGIAIALIGTGCACCQGNSKPSAAKGAELTSAQASLDASGRSLFDGQTLTGWKEADFAGHGEVKVEDGSIILGMGYITGITYTNEIPRMDYEIRLEAMRVDGSDFFCGLTFPVGEDPCSFIVGGWGGGVVGLSSIDGEDAAHNETTQYLSFESGRWYEIRVRVTKERIEAWIDRDQVVNQSITDRKISIRIEMEPCVPLGVATYSTTGALRNLRIRDL